MTVFQLVMRIVTLVLAAVVVGPAALAVWSQLPSVDGGPDATLLVTGSVLSSLARIGIVVFAAGIVGGLGARLVSARWGLWNAGVVLLWLASGTTTAQVVQAAGKEGVLWVLVVESVMMIGLGMGLFWLVQRCSRGAHQGVLEKAGWDEVLPAVLGCAGAAGAGVWILGQEANPVQVIWATGLSSIAGAVVGGVISQRVSILVLIASVQVLGMTVLVVRVAMGSSGLVLAAGAGEIWPVLMPTPLAWLAGALVGVPAGMSWSGALVAPYLSRESEEVDKTSSGLEA